MINIVLPSYFDVGPNLSRILQQSGAKILSALDDLKADFNAKLEDLKTTGASGQETILAAVTAEHDQFMTQFSALQDKLTAALANATDPAAIQAFRDDMAASFDQTKTDLNTRVEAIKTAIANVVTDEASPVVAQAAVKHPRP